jgi:hypothetical protein
MQMHYMHFLVDHTMQLAGFKLTWPPFSTHSCNQVYCRSYPTRDKQTSEIIPSVCNLPVHLHV